jgi:hypothetical protein
LIEVAPSFDSGDGSQFLVNPEKLVLAPHQMVAGLVVFQVPVTAHVVSLPYGEDYSDVQSSDVTFNTPIAVPTPSP